MTETKKTETKKKSTPALSGDKLSWPKVALATLVLVLVILGGYLYRQETIKVGNVALTLESNVISEEEATTLVKEYINTDLLQGQATAEISNLELKNGVYTFKVKIDTQEVDSYVTKDGKLLFPTGMEITTVAKDTDVEASAAVPNASAEITKSDNPEVLLFTMSFCPYGNQAEDGMKPVVELLGDAVNVEPHYVIYDNYGGGGPEFCLDEENKYCSMHGIQELNQNVRELCVYKYQKDKFWSFVDQVNKDCNSKDVDTCWETAADTTGVEKTQIKACETDEALDLLAAEVALSEQHGVSGSPALVINGTTHSGGRAPEDYKTAVCSAYNTAPEKCSETLGTATGDTGEASCGS